MTLITLPSGTNAELKPISAEEDLILRDQKLLRKGLAVDRVLEACVTSIGDDAPTEDKLLDLTALDRSVLLLELRKESYGSEMAFEHACVNCGYLLDLTFDLGDLEVHAPTTLERVDIDLPSGIKATIQAPTGRMERELVKLKSATDHDFLLKCLQTLGGETPSRAAFQQLLAKDLLHLRKTIKATYGFIDDVAVERCDECGATNRISLMTHPHFLFTET